MLAKTNPISLLCAVAVVLVSAAPRSVADAVRGVYDLELMPLATDIYLLRRPGVLRQPVEGNVTVIVNEADVVVIDGGGSPLSAENAIALIRGVTSKPVSVLVNTHWHGDHNLGNQVYRTTFPGLRIVGHTRTREHMMGAPMGYVSRYPKQIGEVIAELSEKRAKGELDERRTELLEDLVLYKQEIERVTITPPDLTFDDSLVLHRGARDIEIRHIGRANTDGDVIVWLPREKILVSGDIVVRPLPYGFGSFPRDWILALESLEKYPFELLVPGHGEVQHDREYLESLVALLTSVRQQAAAAVAKGLDLEATRKAVNPALFPAQFQQPDALRKSLFEAWWISPITRSAWLEARGEPIRQGASDETG